jgi:hypothetical protein
MLQDWFPFCYWLDNSRIKNSRELEFQSQRLYGAGIIGALCGAVFIGAGFMPRDGVGRSFVRIWFGFKLWHSIEVCRVSNRKIMDYGGIVDRNHL